MTDQQDSTVFCRYNGNKPAIFKLALKTSLLTMLTLGIYRFWAKTRIRKYIWSSASGDGDRFEYTGTGLEKFLGFLVAIVILAIYLGLFQILLFYFGLNLFIQPRTEQQALAQIAALYATLLAVVPLVYFAQYRARRYKLSRTRWRGIRFGAEKAAWGYVWRSIIHSFLTFVTLGILLPRQTFYLEKYVTDRTWYGDTKFEQNGRWTDLYSAMRHLFIGLAILIVGISVFVVLQSANLAAVFGFVGYVWLLVGGVSYRVQSFKYLTQKKRLGEQIKFTATPETANIVMTLFVGSLIVGIVGGIVLILVGAVFASNFSGAPGVGTSVVAIITYLTLFALINALSLSMIVQPVISHVVNSITVHNTQALSVVRQRAGDTGADAEGFADALDIGGAI